MEQGSQSQRHSDGSDNDHSIQQKALDELEQILDQLYESEDTEDDSRPFGPKNIGDIWKNDIGPVSFMGNDWKLDIPIDSPLQPNQIEQVHSNFISHVQFGRLLGSGAFGRVYEVTAKIPTKDTEEDEWPTVQLACKVIRHTSETYHSVDQSLKEMKILRYLRHPNICNFKEIIGIEDTITRFPYSVVCLFFELCDGDLHSLRIEGPSVYTGTYKRLSEKLSKYWFTQIVRALQYIHSEGIVHLDLNERNILYKKSLVLAQGSSFEQIFMSSIFKLADFGLSKSYPVWTGEQNTVMSLQSDSQKDIQALAKTLYLTVFGIPFVKYLEIDFNKQDWNNVSPDMKELVFNMTNDSTNWSAPLILQHEWLQDSDVFQLTEHLQRLESLPIEPDLEPQLPQFPKSPRGFSFDTFQNEFPPFHHDLERGRSQISSDFSRSSSFGSIPELMKEFDLETHPWFYDILHESFRQPKNLYRQRSFTN